MQTPCKLRVWYGPLYDIWMTAADIFQSTHGFCTYNYEGLIPQFSDCDSDKSWLEPCSSWVSYYKLPESYLGPMLGEDHCRF